MSTRRITFVDIFCGGGLASEGLKQAGMTPVLGIDGWDTAVSTYKANHGNSKMMIIGNDHDSIDKLARLVIGSDCRVPDLVWLSPPCTEYTCAKGNRPRDENIKAIGLSSLISVTEKVMPSFIVMENSSHIRSDKMFNLIQDQLRRSSYGVHVTTNCASEFGNHSARKRTYFIAAKNETDLSIKDKYEFFISQKTFSKPNPMLVIDLSPSRMKPGFDSLSDRATKAIHDFHNRYGMDKVGCYSYYGKSIARIIGHGNPIRTITCVNRHMLITRHGRRMIDVKECASLMGLPSDYKLPDRRVDAYKIIGNGVAVPVARVIGKFIKEVLIENKTN